MVERLEQQATPFSTWKGVARSTTKAEASRPHSRRLLEIVLDLETVGLESVDRFYEGVSGLAFEPPGTAPTILVGDGDDAVFYGVLVHVVETSVVTGFVGDLAFSVVVPNLSPCAAIKFVDPAC